MLTFLNRWTLAARLHLLLASSLCGLTLLDMRQHMLEEKRLAMRALVDTATSVVAHRHQMQLAGKLTLEAALASLRYAG